MDTLFFKETQRFSHWICELVITFSLNNLVHNAVYISTDKLLELMKSSQKKLAEKIYNFILPVSSKHLDVTQVVGANCVIFYPTGSSGTVVGVSLLVSMSPTFGELVLLCVNHRNIDLNALQN